MKPSIGLKGSPGCPWDGRPQPCLAQGSSLDEDEKAPADAPRAANTLELTVPKLRLTARTRSSDSLAWVDFTRSRSMRTRYTVRALVTSLSILSLLTGLVGCAQPVAFKGRNAIAVAGEPPPPPPPEPPPPPPEPPKPPPRVEVRDDKIEIREKIQFEYNKDIIRE